MYLYTGKAVVTNFEPLIAGEWTTAVAELNRREGSLVVNDGIASKGLSTQRVTLSLMHIHSTVCISTPCVFEHDYVEKQYTTEPKWS